jgi:ParB-like chromosome segregation protein Spo0J
LTWSQQTTASRRAGLDRVPCWVRELDDQAAYMLLATSNAQSELSPLERGFHALHSVANPDDLDIRAYAKSVYREKEERSVYSEVAAARVAKAVAHVCDDLSGHFRPLVEIHAAPRRQWPDLVKRMIKEDWTVEHTRAEASKFKPATPRVGKIEKRGRSRRYDPVTVEHWHKLDAAIRQDCCIPTTTSSRRRGRGPSLAPVSPVPLDRAAAARLPCRSNQPNNVAISIGSGDFPFVKGANPLLITASQLSSWVKKTAL